MTHTILPALVGAGVALAATLFGFALGEVLAARQRRAGLVRAGVLAVSTGRRHRLN